MEQKKDPPGNCAVWRRGFIASTLAIVVFMALSIALDGNPFIAEVNGPPLRYSFKIHFSLLHAAAAASLFFVCRAYFRLCAASEVEKGAKRDDAFVGLARPAFYLSAAARDQARRLRRLLRRLAVKNPPPSTEG